MTRRDFAKTGLGGLLGSVLALWPGKAKGKRQVITPDMAAQMPCPFPPWEPNPLPYVHYGYPRWFRYNKNTSVGKPTTDVLFRMERHDEVVQIHLPSGAESPLQVLDDRWLCSPPRPANLADVVCWLENRLWREITAAEAEALLKSKRIVVCKSTACGWSETDPQREAI